MKDLRDEKIERLERRLLKANRVRPEELREIVAAPQLLAKINARIKKEQAVRSLETAAGARAKFPIRSWPRIGLAFGAAVVFLAGALGLIFFARAADFSDAQLTEAAAAPEIEKPTAAAINENEPPQVTAVENRDFSKKTALKNRTSKSGRRVSKLKTPGKLPAQDEPEEAFYPLAFAENLDEAQEAGQVVRVELSRSSLLALGVNPPTDDENLKVKTDLLIGADGVARGIRFVK